jgi:hypothetical protein
MLQAIIEKQAAEAVSHARSVLRAVRNRSANYDAGRLAVVEKQLANLVDMAHDTGMSSVIFWRGRWLTYKQATAALGEVRSVLQATRRQAGMMLRQAA